MRQPFAPFLLALGLLETPAILAQENAEDQAVELKILGTTDLHGHIYPTTYFKKGQEPLGLAKIATLVKRLRAANPNVVLLDSGDTLQGSPLTDWFFRHGDPKVRVHPMVQAMNELGYTAWGVGNHDFNYGLELLYKARKDAKYPFVTANVYLAGTHKPVFDPFVIREVGGVKVGIIGATPPGVALWDRTHVEGKLEFGDIIESFKMHIPEMRAKGADLVVAIPHAGLGGDGPYGPSFSGYSSQSGLPPENVALRVANEVPGIDLILAGHSHQNIPAVVENGVTIVQADHWGKHLAVVDVAMERRDGRFAVARISSRTLAAAEAVPPDPGMLALVEAMHERTLTYLESPIATTRAIWDSRRSRLEDVAIVDLINAVQIWRTGAQISAAAAFTTEAGFEPGPISIAKVAALYPYENMLVAIEITGSKLREYLEHSARYFAPFQPGAGVFAKDVRGYNYDMISGIDYEIDVTRPIGSRITRMTYQGSEIPANKKLTLALNSYRQRGGGGFEMFRDAPVVYNRDENIRELMIEYLRGKQQIDPADVFVQNWKLAPPGVIEAATARYAKRAPR